MSVLLFIVSVVGLVLLLVEGPIILSHCPKPILKLFCFLPVGAITSLAVRAFAQHSMTGEVLSLFGLCLTLYGGFCLKDLISRDSA